MAYLKNFGTEGVSFDGTTMTGIIAGTVLGNVGNTGDSEGAHLDWNTYENGKAPPVNPLKSKLYGEYLSTKITATADALYLSGMETKSIFDNMDKIMEYYKATKEQSFLDDLYQYQIKPIIESVYSNNRGLRL